MIDIIVYLIISHLLMFLAGMAYCAELHRARDRRRHGGYLHRPFSDD